VSRAAVVVALAIGTAACAPPATVPATTVEVAVEATCEQALAELDDLIAARASQTDFPADRLAEARSLRAAAFDQYVSGDYDLALELVDDALSLLRTAP